MPIHSPLPLLADLVAIDSQVTKSNRAIIDYLGRVCAAYEPHIDAFRKGALDLANLVIRVPGHKPGPPLIFAGHTDTVPANPSWTRNPFAPGIEDGRFYGLGAADMKSGLAAAVAAVLSLDAPPLHDVYLMFTADEEAESGGVRHLCDQPALAGVLQGARIVVCESTNGRIGLGCRGFLSLRITCHGEAFHSAATNYTLNTQKNAIYTAARVLNALMEYEQTLQPSMGELAQQSSQNIGLIQGGTSPNTTADRCSIELSRRIPATETAQQALQALTERIMAVDPTITIDVTSLDEPFATDPASSFVATVKHLSQDVLGQVDVYRGTGWNEGAVYSRFGTTVVFGPGTTANAHQPNEWTAAALVEQMAAIYLQLMQGAAWEA